MSKSIVVVSDIQYPYNHKKQTNAVIKFIGDYQPDEVVFIGDQLDYPQPSRWNKDSRGEFEGSVFKDSKNFCQNVLKPLREVFDGQVGMHRGNHDRRPQDYLNKYAPALSEGSDAFSMKRLLKLDEYKINELPTVYDFAPGWATTHGDAKGISLSRYAGGTAINATRKFNKSIIMGHTHRLGMVQEASGQFATRKLIGVEVGHLMNIREAKYLGDAGLGNWQSGFGIVHVTDNGTVHPQLARIERGTFVVDGVSYSI
ncbi:metallophosphoesterase [Streptomyces albulus]|nr:metallophosphoesterase [Streptomyces noursei]